MGPSSAFRLHWFVCRYLWSWIIGVNNVGRVTMGALKEDNWLKPYINSTEFASNPKLNSLPLEKNEKPTSKSISKKFYFFHTKEVVPVEPRRNSMSSVSRGPNSYIWSNSLVPVVENLPERVNVIREEAGVGHFVREHENNEENLNYDLNLDHGSKPVFRRRSLDYDELDAVKERVSQATDLWKKETQGRDSLDTVSSEECETIDVQSIPRASSIAIKPSSNQQTSNKHAHSMSDSIASRFGKKRGFFSKMFKW